MNLLSFACLYFGIILNICQSKGSNYFFYTYSSNGKVVVNSSDTQLNPVATPNWTTQAFYNASQNLTGWDLLELWSNPSVDDGIQAYHAGYIEGYITRQQIWNSYWNNIESMRKNKTNALNEAISNYFNNNTKYVEEMTTKNQNDPFWYQVGLIYQQMYGMLDGYNNATRDQNLTDQLLTFIDLECVIFIEDLDDIAAGYAYEHNHTSHGNPKDHKNKNNNPTEVEHGTSENNFKLNLRTGSHCSVLIKIVPGNTDVFIGHDTWSSYSQMNRILKRTKLAFKVSKNSSELIPGMSTTFSSYPGMFASMDDFYVINSGLVVTETTNSIFDQKIYKYVRPKNEVLEEVRNVVANRLATNGASWMNAFKRNNSGTYNNQWMIVDLNTFRPGFDPHEGFLTVIEQAPGLIVGGDQTPHILKQGYWASYNSPFYPEISNITGNTRMAIQNGSWYSYCDNPRAKIFKKNQVKVNDLDSMMWMMRYNYYKTDPYSWCDSCDPKPNACNAIASRCDANQLNGTYHGDGLEPALFGAIDAKITSFSLFSKGELLAVSGPTTSGVPAFSWSQAAKNNMTARHLGQPDTWNFEPLITTWILPYTTKSSNDGNDTTPTTTEANKPKKKNSSAVIQPLSLVAYLSIVMLLALKV